MNYRSRVLVVGTTSDYIELIRHSCPGLALFITDPAIRSKASEAAPDPEEEILCNLNDYHKIRTALIRHVEKWNIELGGITCFDCESMELTANLASYYSLPYPSVKSVRNCRDKFTSKMLWHQNNIPCPAVTLINSYTEAVEFFLQVDGPCVIKPRTGSGSELVFRCDTVKDCEMAVFQIKKGLRERQENRLFSNAFIDSPVMIAEEFVSGEEYSCDFVIHNGTVDIIRLTRKIRSRQSTFGTIRGYVLEDLPDRLEHREISDILYRSACVLGITEAVSMVDFLVRNNEIVLLEMTPRPGGDCIPYLLQRALHLNIIKLAMDFALRYPITLTNNKGNTPYAGLRLHAKQSGVLKKINTFSLDSDCRVLEFNIFKKPGDLIRMPPDDYESWLLGHVIIKADATTNIEEQCNDLINRVEVEIES